MYIYILHSLSSPKKKPNPEVEVGADHVDEEEMAGINKIIESTVVVKMVKEMVNQHHTEIEELKASLSKKV